MYYFDSVLHPLATLRKTTEDFFGNEDSYLALNQAIFERYFFISLYTIWETYTKEIVAKIFVDNENLLNSDEFAYYYYESIFSSRELKNKLRKEGIRENLGKIQAEYIFSTNNLWFQRLIDIFKVYGFSNNDLECYFLNNNELKESLRSMRGSPIELTDIYQKIGVPTKEEVQTEYHKIKLYVGYLVNMRNSLTHKYHSPYPKSDPETMKKLITLFQNIFVCIDKYIKDQILDKSVKSGELLCFSDDLNILADKKASRSDLNIKVKMKNDIKIKSSSTIIFCEQDKSIFDRYKIFKVLKVDGLEFSDNIPIFTLDKGNTYQFILESVSNCSGMKKNRSYSMYLDI
ncbi:HEPN domain-containing protein [Enterococcus raffinosus]